MGLFQGAVESLLRCGKPTIARLNGITVGGGNELHLACDLSVAASHIYLGQVGVGVGSVACGGATQWLPLVVGDRRARSMLLLNERIPARKALDWGLVNEVAPSVRHGDEFVDDPTPKEIALAQKGQEGGYRIDLTPLDTSVDALSATAPRDVPGVPPVHQAAGELLEGARLAQHHRPRPRVARPPLCEPGAARGHDRLRREATPRCR